MSKATREAVLITGAAHRIGRALALDLAASGWRVGVHYHSAQDAANALVQTILDAGGGARAYGGDLSLGETPHRLVEDCARDLGPVTCLINNASRFEPDELAGVSQQSWAAHLDINLRAPVFLVQAFARALPETMPGAVINILDQRVWKPTPKFFSYTASKSALWMLTKTMAQALAPRIRVNAIGPGPTLPNERQNQDDFDRQTAATLLQRGPSLEEICAAARFILDTPSLTGQMIAVDGGQHLAWQTPDVMMAKE